jgi:hypothetical protein
MHEMLASDELWKIIEPLLPPDPSREKGGRPRIPNRNAFAGIVHVLKNGVPWRMFPRGALGMCRRFKPLLSRSVRRSGTAWFETLLGRSTTRAMAL